MKQQGSLKISARKSLKTSERICQGDIFQDIEVIENMRLERSKIITQKIEFPFVVCLNQECDLESDYKGRSENLCDKNLLHVAIAPAFIFEQYLNGSQWGGIFSGNLSCNRKDTKVKCIVANEVPRYHYLNFPELDMPELIIDFKHFFTVNRDSLYDQIDKRLCSLDDLFKEKINQRFSYYISRIGLPEHEQSEEGGCLEKTSE